MELIYKTKVLRAEGYSNDNYSCEKLKGVKKGIDGCFILGQGNIAV